MLLLLWRRFIGHTLWIMFSSCLAISQKLMVTVMTKTQIYCFMLFSTKEHLVCSQIHGSHWGFDLAIFSVFNPPLLQYLLPSVLSTGPLCEFSVSNSPGFVISRFYQQILLTPTSFLIALSMAGSVIVTCLSTSKLLPPPQLIWSLLTSHGTASIFF